MLDFKPFSLPTLQTVLPYLKRNKSLCSDLSAGYLYMWHDGIDVRFCIWNDTFVVRQMIGEQPAFSYPIGNDPDGMIDELIQYALSNHLPLRFFAIDDDILDIIRADPRLQPAMWTFDRRWSDYIYSFEDALTFSGKKYSGQRNHINKFKKLYGAPAVRFLMKDDRPDVIKLLDEYASEHAGRLSLEQMELDQTYKLFDVSDILGLYPAGMFIDGKLVAISISEITGNMLMIHVEKALRKYEGIYPAMYSGFVNLIAANLGHPLKYVNREDDSGDPGLRTSKMQYHPVSMANKHLVHVSSPAIRIAPALTIRGENVVLTEIRETDKKAYLAINTDVENNRYWGYDYREDITITGPVDENTFYDSVIYDMRAGDSVNLAIRLSEEGNMIGEAVLWNFTLDGTAELGCRIMPEYQGKGRGKDAFGLAAEMAEKDLDLKVWSRCYRENIPSYRMIAANGFKQVCVDQDFYYFKKNGGKTMEKLQIFYLEHCPYCRIAMNALKELKAENADYEKVEIEWIEETVHPDIADRYDYYRVPSIFFNGVKLYECSPGADQDEIKDQLERSLKAALG